MELGAAFHVDITITTTTSTMMSWLLLCISSIPIECASM